MTRMSFLSNTLSQMESSHPQAVADMIAFAAPSFDIRSNGTVRTMNTGKEVWKPRLATAQLVETFGNQTLGAPSAAALAIGAADYYSHLSQPFCALLPAAVLEVVRNEPSGDVGLSYRRYVKTALLPSVQHVAKLLRIYAATIEWPSVAWMKERFPLKASTEGADSVRRHSTCPPRPRPRRLPPPPPL